MEKSENLYHQIKNHFLRENRPQIVIEIAPELPMDQWKVIPVNDVDEMVDERCRLRILDKDFAGYIQFENEYYFYFLDINIYKSEVVETGRINVYQDRTFSELDLNKVAAEIRQFLQGS